MKREIISSALNSLNDRHISETAVYSPGSVQGSSERIVHMKKKRIMTFVLAAVLMLALGITAYAVGGIPRFVGTCSMADTGKYTSLIDIPKAEKITGYPICLVERFSNGYEFSGMRIDGEAVYDEGFNALEEYYVVHAAYSASGAEEIMLNLSPVQELSGGYQRPDPTSGCFIGDTEVRISRDHYKLVPDDYEKTEEDLVAEASGHFYVSFGSDTIEEKDFVSAEFEIDGVVYDFLCLNAAECADQTLIGMASEIIEAANA